MTQEAISHRIVIVSLHHILREVRPAVLQGQHGFQFFELEPPHVPGNERSFFARGKIVDPRYFDRVQELAAHLWRKTARLASAADSVSPGAVYLAKPANDMREAYVRVANELGSRGYHILPSVGTEIPSDASATAYVGAQLAHADISIHLLGNGMGYSPEDSEPIVKLQLSQAAVRAQEAMRGATEARNNFRRIIWAPILFNEGINSSFKAERDPVAVVERFGDSLLLTDNIRGHGLSEFIVFLFNTLAKTANVHSR